MEAVWITQWKVGCVWVVATIEWGGVGNHGSDLSDWVDKTVLVIVLGEALQAQGAEATPRGNQVSKGSMSWSCLSSWGSHGSSKEGSKSNLQEPMTQGHLKPSILNQYVLWFRN